MTLRRCNQIVLEEKVSKFAYFPWLDERTKLSAHTYDTFVQAEILNPKADSHLQKLMLKYVIYELFHALTLPCMQDSLCAMGLFRPYSNRTFYTDNAYLTYRRRSSKVSGFVGCKKPTTRQATQLSRRGLSHITPMTSSIRS